MTNNPYEFQKYKKKLLLTPDIDKKYYLNIDLCLADFKKIYDPIPNKADFKAFIIDDISEGNYLSIKIYMKIYMLTDAMERTIELDRLLSAITKCYNHVNINQKCKNKIMEYLSFLMSDQIYTQNTLAENLISLYNTIHNLQFTNKNLKNENNQLKEEIKQLKLHIEYSPGGSGYLEAEEHFMNSVNNV